VRACSSAGQWLMPSRSQSGIPQRSVASVRPSPRAMGRDSFRSKSFGCEVRYGTSNAEARCLAGMRRAPSPPAPSPAHASAQTCALLSWRDLADAMSGHGASRIELFLFQHAQSSAVAQWSCPWSCG
jgi:hypothetical protein